MIDYVLKPRIIRSIKLEKKLDKVEIKVDLIKNEFTTQAINYAGIEVGTPKKYGENLNNSYNNFQQNL